MRRRSVMLTRFILARGISTTAAKMQQPSLIKLRKLQAQFQAEDGKLVWQKGGFKDRVLYMTTWILIAIGFTMSLDFIWECMKPPQWKQKQD